MNFPGRGWDKDQDRFSTRERFGTGLIFGVNNLLNFRCEPHFIEEYSKEAVPKSYNVILHIFNHRLPKLANGKFNGMKMINAL